MAERVFTMRRPVSFDALRTCLTALLMAASLLPAVPGVAGAQDLYAVSGLMVDERAESEVAAKQAGIVKAKRKAFRDVLHRLTQRIEIRPGADSVAETPSAADGIPVEGNAAMTGSATPEGAVTMPDGEHLERLIRDVSFQNEKFGGGHYLAEMTVRFQPEAVNRYLQRNGIAYLGAPSPLAVILPIFRQNGTDLLWTDTNPWLDAWSRLETGGTVVPFMVPLGDLSDLSIIDATRAMAVDSSGINGIAARYNAGAVAIPVAAFAADGAMLIELSTFGAGWPTRPELLRYPREMLAARAEALRASEAPPKKGPHSGSTLLHAAASLTLEALEARWKRGNVLRFDQEAETLIARVGLTDLSDWLSVRDSLDSVASIRAWRLSELTIAHAVVEIDYVGDTAQLSRALARQAMVLISGKEVPGEKGDIWLLTRR